jgi:ribosomal protein L34
MTRGRAASRLPKLPQLLERKLYKTGQTRGADDDEIYQNRVLRQSTVLIPYNCWGMCRAVEYKNGFIVLISPRDYFNNPNIAAELASHGLEIGRNALVFYETRDQWSAHNPESLRWVPAERRIAPLGGQYVARISATTALSEGSKIVRGFTATALKGAGIRAYEYASSAAIVQCREQLEALFWCCHDSSEVAARNGMTPADVATRKMVVLEACKQKGLLDMTRLTAARILNSAGRTICPLCLEELSAHGFFSRMAQAEGRAVLDLTITQVNLFHIQELRYGATNHTPYNLGWGHHHCNVVVKDAGIIPTLEWMREIVSRNIADGHISAENKPI